MKITIEMPSSSAGQTGNTESPAQTIVVTEADGGAAVFNETNAVTESNPEFNKTDSFDAGSPPEWLLTELQHSLNETQTSPSSPEESIDGGSAAF